MRWWFFILLAMGISFSAVGKRAQAIFAGGCFWCLEPPFEKTLGVLSAVSGYIGGASQNARYELVSVGKTRHVEAVQILYDDGKVSYRELVNLFLRQIDPTQEDGQFVDRGPQYRSGIYYLNQEQKKIAEKALQNLAKSKRFKKKIAVRLLPAGPFFKAEDYHQDYYKKNPYRYKFYRLNSGRDRFIRTHWK